MFYKKRKNNEESTFHMLGNLMFNFANTYKWDKKLFYFQFICVFPNIISGYLGTLLPAKLVEVLELRKGILEIVILILGMTMLMMLFDTVYKTTYLYLYRNSMSLALYYDKLCFSKIMHIDYDKLEEEQNQVLIKNTWNVLRNEFAIRNSITGMPDLLIAILSTMWYGTILLIKSPAIILITLLCVITSYFLVVRSRKIYLKYNKQAGTFSKEAAYINRQAMDQTAGKDIRIFQMQKLFISKYDHAINGMNTIYNKIHNSYILQGVVTNITIFISTIIPYGLLLYYLLVENTLTLPEFILYNGLLAQFSGNFYSMIGSIRGLNSINASLNHIRSFLSMNETVNLDHGISEDQKNELLKNGIEIELRNVTYTYPGNEEPTLKNINLIIHKNEKIALIGLNGAGKTTLVKLLCGFYKQNEGEIIINGISSERFSAKDRENLISALFQDSMLFPLTLDENLCGDEENKNEDQLKDKLKISGFDNIYYRQKHKGNTLLIKEVNGNATDFSGGEKQKLFFTRALYKSAPLLILDEPTAALDPISENELYQKYGIASKNRTSIFISHRLSSTRFCDRIILLENAEIREEGTHEELIRHNGRYANLYEIQSKYYKENNPEESYEKERMD